MQPNTYFYVSARVRNPSATPSSNYWPLGLQNRPVPCSLLHMPAYTCSEFGERKPSSGTSTFSSLGQMRGVPRVVRPSAPVTEGNGTVERIVRSLNYKEPVHGAHRLAQIHSWICDVIPDAILPGTGLLRLVTTEQFAWSDTARRNCATSASKLAKGNWQLP